MVTTVNGKVFCIEFWRQGFVFLAGFAFVVYTKGGDWFVASWTFVLALAVLACNHAMRDYSAARVLLAYLAFFVTPILSLTGQISVLTGFGGSGASNPWVGVSFVSASLALHVFTRQLGFRSLWTSILQPLRMNSGPVALVAHSVARVTPARIRYYAGWIVLGAFFYGVLSAAIEPLLVLKGSTDPLDSLVFATLFEFYVYFNFSGITFMVFGVLSLAGVKTVINFNTPFAARDVVGYWQRWHVSLTTVLKEIFFRPLKGKLGISASVFLVFLASAAWHGVSMNFFLWGLFHATGWVLAHAIWRQFPGNRLGFMVNLALFPFFVIIGRLIFSEADFGVLLEKLWRLMHFSLSADAMVMNMVIDARTAALLALGAICISAEILLGRRHRRYRLLRKTAIMPLLALITIAFGSTGLGGVYGAR